LNDKLIIFIETLEKKFNNKELMTTSWAMNTGMIADKGAKHLTIIHWNFWNHSFSLTKGISSTVNNITIALSLR
jgi:hypothetical protein